MKPETSYVFLIITWLLTLAPTAYFMIVVLDVRHTYVLPSANCVGHLTSDYWNFETIREAFLLVFYIIVPWTLVLMLWSKERIGWGFHLFFLCAALIWCIANAGFDINDGIVANVPPDDSNFKDVNYARDLRWCTLYGGQPGTTFVCTNTKACTAGGILIENLSWSNYFKIRVIANVIFIILMGFDLYYSIRYWQYGTAAAATTSSKLK